MNLKPFWSLVITLLLIGSSAFAFVPNENVQISMTLKNLTPEDRFFLDYFFRATMLGAKFSYVLFGSKPMAFTSYDKTDIRLDPVFIDMILSEKLFAKAAEVYRKYEHLVHPRNCFLRFYDFPEGTVIVIIHKKHFLETFNKYEESFKEVLGPSITGEILFDRILTVDDIAEVLQNHEGLLGTLLGYGKNNSWLFSQRSAIRQELSKVYLSLKRRESLKKEFEAFNQRLASFRDYAQCSSEFSLVSLPSFVADLNDSETKELKKIYLEDRKKIIKAYGKGHFLEITLKQLCS